MDAISLNLKDATTTKVKITTDCDSAGTTAYTAYELSLTLMNVCVGTKVSPNNTIIKEYNGVVSQNIISTFRAQITDGITTGKTSKIAKYDEVVSGYNKVLLASIVVPLIDKVCFLLPDMHWNAS